MIRRQVQIAYTEFRIPGLATPLYQCGWCTALVADSYKHNDMHSCGCSAEFRVQFEGHIHEVGPCPLAEDCGDHRENPPCGSCDRCQLAQVTWNPGGDQ